MPDAPEKSSGSDAPERSIDFRYFASDAVGMSFNDNSCKLIFGIEEKPGHIIEQTGIFMTPTTMKLLSVILSLTIENHEKTTGSVIHLDEEKVKKLKETLSVTSPPDRDSNA